MEHTYQRLNPVLMAAVAGILVVAAPMASWGQQASPGRASQETARSNSNNQALTDQIMKLRREVATLRGALQGADLMRSSQAASRGKMGGGAAMPMMDDQGEMGGMSSGGSGGMGMMEHQGEMGGMSSGGRSSGMSGGRGMMDEGEMGGMSSGGGGMGMCCMGEMGSMMGGMARPGAGMAGMKASPSTMPGQPGASHLYHIGSTGFFLDHAKHLVLTPEQQMRLNRLKEKTLLDRSTQQRRIDQAEQELYLLTGADQPDASQIQAKIAEIEKLRADQRMNFIRGVSEAAGVLTHDQHRTLLGTMTSNQK
jgi:Spy/CpxP family protein refolding chaperone